MKLLTDPLCQRVVKEPRIEIVEGGAAEETLAMQDQRADRNRGDRHQVDKDGLWLVFRAGRLALDRQWETAAHAARATANTDNPNGNATPRRIARASMATTP